MVLGNRFVSGPVSLLPWPLWVSSMPFGVPKARFGRPRRLLCRSSTPEGSDSCSCTCSLGWVMHFSFCPR